MFVVLLLSFHCNLVVLLLPFYCNFILILSSFHCHFIVIYLQYYVIRVKHATRKKPIWKKKNHNERTQFFLSCSMFVSRCVARFRFKKNIYISIREKRSTTVTYIERTYIHRSLISYVKRGSKNTYMKRSLQKWP